MRFSLVFEDLLEKPIFLSYYLPLN